MELVELEGTRMGIKSRVVATLASIAVLGFGAAHAQAVKFYSYGNGADHPPGEQLVSLFFLDSIGAAPTAHTGNTSWSSSTPGTIEQGSVSGQWAAPAISASAADPFKYLALTDGESETLTFTHAVDRYLQVYIGSLDSFNEISFKLANGNTDNYFGTALGAISGADGGNQTASNTNGLFTFLFGSAIKSVTFSSGGNSFEIAGIVAAPTPEPATWMLMILGVGLAGGALRLARKDLEVRPAVA
jgi:hypothetical protein